ncbi:MAG: hypothetical protein KJZ86_13705 [Caldilineaceae bacterium]|nr:hypothetical protein [Caldilineaceae bacterium]HRJ40767.1 hypothetical protein [Caldilineaceae bacterium]
MKPQITIIMKADLQNTLTAIWQSYSSLLTNVPSRDADIHADGVLSTLRAIATAAGVEFCPAGAHLPIRKEIGRGY